MREDHTIQPTGAIPPPLGGGSRSDSLPSIETWQPPKMWTKAAGQHSASSIQLRDLVARNSLPGTAAKEFETLGAESAQALVGLVGLMAISQKGVHQPFSEALITGFKDEKVREGAVKVVAHALKQRSPVVQVQHGKNIEAAMRLLTRKPTTS